jgi:hypothetical protein
MAKDNIETPNLFNPMMLWTDLGMRALEMTLSSSQNIGDGIDRLSRASASPEASETAVAPIETISQESSPAFPVFPDLNLFLQMQRSILELMTQAWQQWMNTFATLASFGAGRSFAETARENPMLNAMQEILLRNTEETAATRARQSASSGSPAGRKRERHADDIEHAFGAAETKRGGRASRAKPKARSRKS